MIETKEKQTNNDSQSIAVSAKQLSQLLGASLRQCWRLNATGKIPHPVRLGGSVRWNRVEITQWFESGCPDRQTWEARKEVENAKPK
ncbi:MAG: helix-turn-helix transcriptional regulator [Candidatus Hodarchaeota archaeon]